MEKSSEEKILIAARKLFLKKGYVNTRSRDIAKEAGINLALLNYYFRSKENLFSRIMQENLRNFFSGITVLVAGVGKREEKIRLFVESYIDLLCREPDLPLFVLGELRSNPGEFLKLVKVNELWQELGLGKKGKSLQEKKEQMAAIQFFMSLFGMTVFPFIAKPVMMEVGKLNQKEFQMLMEQRKKLIPEWMDLIIKKGK